MNKTIKSILIILSVLIVCIYAFLFQLAENGWCMDSPDYCQPVAGWTSEELEEATLQCVSERINEVRTETATLMLEKICYFDAIAKGRN